MAESSESSQKRLCSEAAQLIQKVLTAPEPDRSDAWQELLEKYIKPIARMVLGGFVLSAQLRRKFEDDYPAKVWQELSKFKMDGNFCAWCQRVLHNWAIDLCRKEKPPKPKEPVGPEVRRTKRKSSENQDEEIPDSRTPQAPVVVASGDVLEKGVIDQLAQLPVMRRVIVCAAAGWAWRIPQPIWQQWLSKAGLPSDFPPSELAEYDDPMERIDFLSEYLNISRPALYMHWRRSLKVLQEICAGGEVP